MSNDEVYAGGLLNRALDPASQPPEIRAFVAAEIDLLREAVPPGSRLIDIGCGTGRHLRMLDERLGLGVGVDVERRYLAEARRHAAGPRIRFVMADAAAVPLTGTFDAAVCLMNTWGTMHDKAAVLDEMRRLSPRSGSRLLTVFSPASVPARRIWYGRLGHPVLETSAESLLSEGGFRSEHFTEDRLRDLLGECTIRPLSPIGYAATF